MATPARRPASLSLLLLLLVSTASFAPMSSSALRFHRQHMSVNILNDLGTEALQLHCQSHNDDLGARTLAPTQWYGWGFEANVLGTTLYWCTFAAGPRSQGFNVFQDIGLWGNHRRPCRQCVWVVRPDGFYRSEKGGQALSTKVYDWK